MKRELEHKIDDEKVRQQKEAKTISGKLDEAREEVGRWKQKYRQLQDAMDAQDASSQQAKMRLLEEHQSNITKLKNKYHQNKMLFIGTGMEDARNLQDTVEI